MSQQESDLLFVKSYLDGINIVSNNTKGMHCGVLDLELNSIFASEWVATMGVTPEELKKLLLDPKINQYRKKAINEEKIVKILIARSLPLAGTKVAIAAYSPVFNPQTHNLVALHVSVNLLDVFNLSNILARYYKNGDLDLHELKGPSLTEREKQVIFFFLLNLESATIAEILSNIENKSISKSAIDQMFTRQLLPKFGVYSRKALYDKLSDNGYTRLIPQNILNEGILVEVTDFVVFN